MMKFLLIIFALLFNFSYSSIEEDLTNLNQKDYELYNEISSSLRCVVCANQTIKSSNADISLEFKRIIIEKIKQNKTKKEIINFFEQRYGEKVNYNPSFSIKNFILWVFPFVILIILLLYFIRHQKNKYPK